MLVDLRPVFTHRVRCLALLLTTCFCPLGCAMSHTDMVWGLERQAARLLAWEGPFCQRSAEVIRRELFALSRELYSGYLAPDTAGWDDLQAALDRDGIVLMLHPAVTCVGKAIDSYPVSFATCTYLVHEVREFAGASDGIAATADGARIAVNRNSISRSILEYFDCTRQAVDDHRKLISAFADTGSDSWTEVQNRQFCELLIARAFAGTAKMNLEEFSQACRGDSTSGMLGAVILHEVVHCRFPAGDSSSKETMNPAGEERLAGVVPAAVGLESPWFGLATVFWWKVGAAPWDYHAQAARRIIADLELLTSRPLSNLPECDETLLRDAFRALAVSYAGELLPGDTEFHAFLQADSSVRPDLLARLAAAPPPSHSGDPGPMVVWQKVGEGHWRLTW